MNKGLKGFITYSHKDAAAKDELRKRLAVMEQKDEFTTWHDGEITPGDKWYEDISQNLAETDILLYLVSAASLDSKNCNKELAEALKNDITVIPIILEHCDWQSHSLINFEALPLKGRPITKWDDPSKAWQNVVDGVRRAIRKIRSQTSGSSETSEKELLAKLVLQHGNLLMMLKQTEAAINVYSEAIDLNLHDANAYSNRSTAYRNVVWEAVQEVTGGDTKKVFEPKDIIAVVLEKYPDLNKRTVGAQIVAGCPNHPSYDHHSGNYKFYWRIGYGKYRLYDPEKDKTETAVNEDLSEGQLQRIKFWTELRDYMSEKDSQLRFPNPSPHSFLMFSMGSSDFSLQPFFRTRLKAIGISLYVSGENATAHFHLLKEQQAEIENEFGEPLEWAESPKDKSNRISLRKEETDPGDERNWPDQHEWFASRLESFDKVFRPRIKALDADDWVHSEDEDDI